MNLKVLERPGRCRWCGCTYNDPCPEGCGWANRQQTLCTACAEFDRLMKSREGRSDVVGFFKQGMESSL